MQHVVPNAEQTAVKCTHAKNEVRDVFVTKKVPVFSECASDKLLTVILVETFD